MKIRKTVLIEEKILMRRGRENPEVKKIQEKIISSLSETPVGTSTAIDFQNMEALDFSAADEIVGIILGRIRSGEIKDRFIILENLNEGIEENVKAVLRFRKLACWTLSEGKYRALGSLKFSDTETLDLIRKEKKITSRKLSDVLKKPINTCSNRLNKLAKLGLIYRSREIPASTKGRQFLYELIF